MASRPPFRALAFAALCVVTATGCTVNGLSLTAPTGGKGSAAPGTAASGTPGAQQPGGQQGTGALVFPNNVKPSGAPAGGTQPGQAGSPQPGHSHDPLAVASLAPGETPAPQVQTAIGAAVPAIYQRIYGASSLTVEGGYLVVSTQNLPDHNSQYYAGTAWADKANPEAPGKAPGSITETTIVFRIPLNPTEAATKAATNMGPIGVALNGIAYYNQYAMGGVDLGREVDGFDDGGGHPDPSGKYHYHMEPEYLTTKFGKDGLIGFLLDGFPVYGPEEGGKTLVSADLDSYHGHFGVTADYPAGIYHYHTTADAPYINGAGFYGTPGTVSYGGAGTGTGTGTGGTMSPPPGGTGSPPPGGTGSPPPGGTQSPPPGGMSPQPGGSMPPPPSGCPTPPPPGQTPAPPPPGSSPPPAYCPKPPAR